MDSVSFTVLGEPTGKGRPRFNTQSGRAYTPKKTVNYETWVKWNIADSVTIKSFLMMQ